MGRPKKYTDQWIDRMAGRLVKYAKSNPLPLKQDFASQHRFASEMMSRFSQKSVKFYQALKRFEDIQQKKIISAAMVGKINTTFAIFTLKNVAGWRDVQEFQGPGGTALMPPNIILEVRKHEDSGSNGKDVYSRESIGRLN